MTLETQKPTRKEKTLKVFKEGDFVFIPASTLFYKFESEECNWVSSSTVFADPLYVAYVGRNSVDPKWCNVFVDGQVWSVKEEDMFLTTDLGDIGNEL